MIQAGPVTLPQAELLQTVKAALHSWQAYEVALTDLHQALSKPDFVAAEQCRLRAVSSLETYLDHLIGSHMNLQHLKQTRSNT